MDKNLQYNLRLKDFFKKPMLSAMDSTKRLDAGMNKLNGTISKVATGLGAYFGGQALLGFGKSVIDSLKNYEYFSASVRVLMHGDRQAAKALEGQLVSLAQKTPFQLTDVQAGSKQLLAYGFAAGTLVDNMKMLGDVSSGVGAPLTDIIYLYGTLKTQGRAYTRDIMQFTSRGIPIIRELAKQFHTTEKNVQSLVESGKVGFPEIEKAFRSMTTTGGDFFGMMDEQSKTIGGKLSNLGDSWEQLKVNIGKSQSGIIAGTTDFISGMVGKLQLATSEMNRMEDAFTRFGAKQFTFVQDWGGIIASAFNINTVKTKLDMFDRSLQTLYVKPSSRNEVEALRSQQQLLNMRANYGKAFANKEIDKTEYQRGTALISYALEQVSGNLKLLRSKPETSKDKALGTAASGGIGSPTEVSAPRQNVNIHIEKFGVIEHLTATDNLRDPAKQVKDEWAKEFLEMLKDANLMSRR